MKSILQDSEDCYFYTHRCDADPDHPMHTWQQLHKHHIFGGANRKLSEKYGLWVNICCIRCHNGGPESVHMKPNQGKDLFLKQQAQRAFESHTYKDFQGSREKFMEIFGRNYL